MSVFIVVNEDVIADGLGEEYKKAVRESELKKQEEKEKIKQSVLKDIDNHGRIQCSKEQATTLVCDGAFIKCSMGTFKSELEIKNESSNTGWIVQKPDFSPEIDNEPSDMIEFKVTDPKAYLMGIDPAGTVLHKGEQNFKPKPSLKCRMGGLCEIQKRALRWENYSRDLIINGFPALIKGSKLICGKCESADIGFTDNGQDFEIALGNLDGYFSQYGWSLNGKKTVKSIFPGIGVGIGIFAITKGRITEGGSAVLGGTRDLVQIWTGQDIFIPIGKGIIAVGETISGVKLDESTKNKIVEYGIAIYDFPLTGSIISFAKNPKNFLNMKYKTIKNGIIDFKNGKLVISDDYKIVSLKPKWGEILKEGGDVLLNKTLGNIKTDEYQFAVHIEHAKNPVLTTKRLEKMGSR